MDMKKYTRASAQGFTLVELIVVIVILAILATIAFLSFSSQSSAARDSKRKTDLSSLASKINVTQAQGTSLMAMVATADNKLAGTAGIAGWVVSDTSAAQYNAGDINFTVLGVNSADFEDPSTGDAYPIGATMLDGQAFQLAAMVENDADGNATTNGAVLNGNYQARAADVKTVTNPETGILNVDGAVVGFFKTGDKVTVTDGTTPVNCEIKSISMDKTKITLKTIGATTVCATTPTSISAVLVSGAESPALIANSAGGTVVENGVTAPY